MSALEQKLAAQRERSAAKIGPERLAVMHRVTKELGESALHEQVLDVGQMAPEIALPDGDGNEVSSRALLDEGPLVVTFYRGKW